MAVKYESVDKRKLLQVIAEKMSKGEDPSRLRYALTLYTGDEQIVNDAFQTYQNISGTGGSNNQLSGLSQEAKTVYENPQLFEGLTPTKKDALMSELSKTDFFKKQAGNADLHAKERLGTGVLLQQYYTNRNIVSSLQEYKNKYLEATKNNTLLPTEITGKASAELRAMYNDIIFQVAQAEGTGALQAADREVVEQMLPNVSSINPFTIAGQAMRGGVKGNVSAFDVLINRANERVQRYAGQEQTPQRLDFKSPEEVQAWLGDTKNQSDPRYENIKQEFTKLGYSDTQDQPTPSADVLGAAGKVGKTITSFTGGDDLGSAIGNKLGGFFAKHGEAGKIFQDSLQKLAELKSSGKISEEQFKKLVDNQEQTAKSAFGYDGPSFRKVVGDVMQLALTIGTASVAAPVGAVAKVAAGVATGYGFDVAGNLQNEQKDLGESYKPGLGTAVGAAIPLLGMIKNAVSKGGQSVAERVYNSGVKPTLEDTKRAILYNGKTLGRKLLDEGVVGTNAQLLKRSLAEIAKHEAPLQKILIKSSETITREELAPYLASLKDTLANTPTSRAQSALNVVDDALKLLPESMSLQQANVFKRNLYNEIGDLAYKIDPNLSSSAEASKAIAAGLRDLIEKKTGNEVVRTLNQKLATAYQLQDSTLTNLSRTMRNQLAGVGTPGAIIEKTLGATVVKTLTATVLDRASKILQRAGAGVGGRITKAMVLDAIAQAKAKEDDNL